MGIEPGQLRRWKLGGELDDSFIVILNEGKFYARRRNKMEDHWQILAQEGISFGWSAHLLEEISEVVNEAR